MGVFWRLSRRKAGVAAVAGALLAGLVVPTAMATTNTPSCHHPVLVLSAMPLELNPLVAKTALRGEKEEIDGRTFYMGRLAGNEVVLAMTGIGLVNAEQTATAAFEHFHCTFAAAMFSGVAGSQHNIGDVTVPARWTRDGKHWIAADPEMVKLASTLNSGNVKLSQDVPVGDAACACPGVDAATPVHMPQPAQVYVGGAGESSDMFGGHAVPCLPGGGDIEGCEPCITAGHALGDAMRFASNAPKLSDPGFWEALLQPPAQTTSNLDAQDEETAAVAEVAGRYHVPFLGVRAASDGKNDPLHLPGFPFQFAVYRQLAGNNAAAVTIAFLQRWHDRPGPDGAGYADD
jgi:nucleoside phosphorylase